MSVRIAETKDGKAVMFCSTKQWAFGPIFDSPEQANEFLNEYLRYGQEDGTDPRTLPDIQLENLVNDYNSNSEGWWDHAATEKVAG